MKNEIISLSNCNQTKIIKYSGEIENYSSVMKDNLLSKLKEWRLDQERLLRVRTTTKYRNAFADVEETTEIYTFDKRELMLIKHFSETTTEDKSTQKKGGKK